jgi:hypothetical protein
MMTKMMMMMMEVMWRSDDIDVCLTENKPCFVSLTVMMIRMCVAYFEDS